MTAWESGRIGAPKKPCSARHATSDSSVVAIPQKIEATVKAAQETKKTSLRPKRVLAQPDTVRSLANAGLEPAPANSPEEFAAFLKAEIVKWSGVVKASGARAD